MGEERGKNVIDNVEFTAHCWQVTNGEPWVYQVLVIAWLEYISWKAVQLHTSICCASQSRIVFYPFPLLPSLWKLISSFTKRDTQQNLKKSILYTEQSNTSSGTASSSGIDFPSFHGMCPWSPEYHHHLVSRAWCCQMGLLLCVGSKEGHGNQFNQQVDPKYASSAC